MKKSPRMPVLRTQIIKQLKRKNGLKNAICLLDIHKKLRRLDYRIQNLHFIGNSWLNKQTK